MSLQACAEITRKGDPDRFLSAMAADPVKRAVLFPIYAFNVEVARAPWVTEEPMIAEMRLQWWRDALAEIAKGSAASKHEVVSELAHVIDQTGADLLGRLIDARRWDIYREAFQDDDHFHEYLDATAGGLMLVAARALGAEFGHQAIRDYGAAAGLASWFRAVPELEMRGRLPLVDGRRDAVARLASNARMQLKSTCKSIPKIARPATRSGWQADRTLRSAAANPAVVTDGRLHSSEFHKKTTLIWRILRGLP